MRRYVETYGSTGASTYLKGIFETCKLLPIAEVMFSNNAQPMHKQQGRGYFVQVLADELSVRNQSKKRLI